jgi:GT2 family glycosyltransferase
MRVALACRDLASDRLTGPGARVFASALAMARAGHDVYLLSEEFSASRARALLSAGSPTWIRVERTRPDHRYLIEEHRYADWVWDTLRDLHRKYPLDAAEFLDAGAEGLTTIRAKRLLGAFPTTTLAVTVNPWATVRHGPDAHRPMTFRRQLREYAERYCAEHADVRRPVTVLKPVPGRMPSTQVDPAAARTVWRIGAIRPAAGLGTFLRAADLVLAADSRFRFVLRGEDTDTDPLGRSYWRHLHRRLPDRVRDAVTFGGPLRSDEAGSMPPTGTQCVLPEGAVECPTSTALAMAMGYAVLAAAGSTAADLVDDGATGTVVPAGDPAPLADALLAGAARPAETARLACNALKQVSSWDGVIDDYPRQPGRRDGPAGHDLVSVIIPLYNQGRYLREAVESARASGYADVEIVVVDDGSTEAATVAAFDALTGVVKVRQHNAGLPAARNTGIAASHGRYVVPLDADDALPPGFLGPAVSALRRHQDLAYVVGYLRYTGLLDHVHAPIGFAGDVSLVLNTHGRATGVFRREALLAVHGYDESLPAYEDWDLHIRMHKAGYRSDVLPVEAQVYRRHRDSMTFRHTNDLRMELLQLLLRKHADMLPPERALPLLLMMAHLWKTGYEPSASVRLQDGLNGPPGIPRNG